MALGHGVLTDQYQEPRARIERRSLAEALDREIERIVGLRQLAILGGEIVVALADEGDLGILVIATVVTLIGPRLVGAATGTPLADHAADFAAALAACFACASARNGAGSR